VGVRVHVCMYVCTGVWLLVVYIREKVVSEETGQVKRRLSCDVVEVDTVSNDVHN